MHYICIKNICQAKNVWPVRGLGIARLEGVGLNSFLDPPYENGLLRRSGCASEIEVGPLRYKVPRMDSPRLCRGFPFLPTGFLKQPIS